MRQETVGSILLVLVWATLVVGLSIVLDGSAARALNGLGGVTWIAAAALLLVAAGRSNRSPRLWIAILFLTALVAFIIRPSDLLSAILGFAFIGIAVVWLSPSHDLLWAKLIVGLYLPFHIGAAITKAAVQSFVGIEATVRTDPPPTSALVPFLMTIAALGGGVLARFLVKDRCRNQRRNRLEPDSEHA